MLDNECEPCRPEDSYQYVQYRPKESPTSPSGKYVFHGYQKDRVNHQIDEGNSERKKHCENFLGIAPMNQSWASALELTRHLFVPDDQVLLDPSEIVLLRFGGKVMMRRRREHAHENPADQITNSARDGNKH
jgi:hypothetical protein